MHCMSGASGQIDPLLGRGDTWWWVGEAPFYTDLGRGFAGLLAVGVCALRGRGRWWRLSWLDERYR